jgi:hypothetical protein
MKPLAVRSGLSVGIQASVSDVYFLAHGFARLPPVAQTFWERIHNPAIVG